MNTSLFNDLIYFSNSSSFSTSGSIYFPSARVLNTTNGCVSNWLRVPLKNPFKMSIFSFYSNPVVCIQLLPSNQTQTREVVFFSSPQTTRVLQKVNPSAVFDDERATVHGHGCFMSRLSHRRRGLHRFQEINSQREMEVFLFVSPISPLIITPW